MVIYMRTRRKVLPYPQWLNHRGLCHWEKVEAWQCNRYDRSTHGFAMPSH